jgi:sugar lactone lactonase YvrE
MNVNYHLNGPKRSTSFLALFLLLVITVAILILYLPSVANADTEKYVFARKWGSHCNAQPNGFCTPPDDGQFSSPFYISLDSHGNAFVLDYPDESIKKFTTDGKYIKKWGSLGLGDGQFNGPGEIAVDPSGFVYVADLNSHRVQKFTNDGKFVTKWSAGDAPFGIALDSSGYVYVTDFNNYEVLKFTNDGKFVTKWGSFGTGDGQFTSPLGVAVDSSGYVYVADRDIHNIQKFTNDGKFVTKWGSFGTGDGQFNEPVSIALDNLGYLYITDSKNNRIQKFTNDGKFVTKWGSFGTGDGQFNFPRGIAVDASGFVYATDSGNYRIEVFEKVTATTIPDTAIVSAVDGDNVLLKSGDSTLSNRITFTFVGNDTVGISLFECSVDNSVFVSCTSPKTYEELAYGDHTFRVKAIDSSGNKDPTPASFSWKILTPAEGIQKLIDTIRGMDMPNSIKTGFISSLQQALTILNDNNPSNDKIVCAKLDIFLQKVNTNLIEADIKITKSQADTLIHLTTAIKNRLDCPALLPPDSESQEMPERSEPREL